MHAIAVISLLLAVHAPVEPPGSQQIDAQANRLESQRHGRGPSPPVVAGPWRLESNYLSEGGNAADAAAATLLALAVTDYGSFAIGGEVPLLIFDAKKQEVKALSGAGRAPLDPKAIEWFYANGIPAKGSMKSAPAPGAVHLCVTLLQRLRHKISSRPPSRPFWPCWTPARRTGTPILPSRCESSSKPSRNAQGTREEKLAAARDRFYLEGDVADELEAWYISTGAFLRKTDLAAHKTVMEDPVMIRYRGYNVYKCGPWTQGPTLCQTLRLLEGFDLKTHGPPLARLHPRGGRGLQIGIRRPRRILRRPAVRRRPSRRPPLRPLHQIFADQLIDLAKGFLRATARQPAGNACPSRLRHPRARHATHHPRSKTPPPASSPIAGETSSRPRRVAIWSATSPALPA